MPSHPDDVPPTGDRESDRWWEELAWLDDPERSRPPVPSSRDRRLDRAARRRRRARARSGPELPPPGVPPQRPGLGRRGSRSLMTFLALLLVAAGVVSLVEDGWRRAREASFSEGAHLDGTPVQGVNGTYAFLATQRGTQEPVTYGPCRTIQVQINPSGEVTGGSQLVLDAMATVSDLTGLRLVYSGPSSERPDTWRERMTTGGLEAYPPVLVSWSDEEETPDLAGDVVGLGGSISLRGGGYARARYMTGSVTLDAPDLAEIAEQSDGEAQVRAVILHELGHLVGLGHVNDPRELMSESNTGQLDFGPGDKEGLARLGGEDC